MICLGYLIEPNGSSSSNKLGSNGMTLQRSNSLTSLTSNTPGTDESSNSNKDGTNQEYLRICLTCRGVLQRLYNQISFRNMEKDEVFRFYEVNLIRPEERTLNIFS